MTRDEMIEAAAIKIWWRAEPDSVHVDWDDVGGWCRERYRHIAAGVIDLIAPKIAQLEAENARLLRAVGIAALWTAEPGTTLAEIRAALQPEDRT